MPENTEAAPAAPTDATANTFALTAATMGRDLTKALLDELRNLPDHWSRMNQDLQQKTLDRFKDRVAETVKTAVNMLTASNFQAVPAKLEYVSRKQGIKAGLTVQADALCRHALFDAAGGKVLVVIADPNAWLQRMDEIKVTGNQADLFDSADTNYDPARDQPGYRRDQDQFAAGPSWQDIKANLGIDKPAETPPPVVDHADERQRRYDEAFARIYGKPQSELTDAERQSPEVFEAHQKAVAELDAEDKIPSGDDEAVDSHRVSLEQLREQLAGLGLEVSLGALQSREDADILAATLWLEAVEKMGLDAAAASRPAWLPELPKRKGKK